VLGRDGQNGERVRHEDEPGERTEVNPPEEPVMPAPPFPAFRSVPTLPQQPPHVGFESGRDSRAR
jgi:hypothetical protein